MATRPPKNQRYTRPPRAGSALATRPSVMRSQPAFAQNMLEELLKDTPPPDPNSLQEEVRGRALLFGVVIAACLVAILGRGVWLMALAHPSLEERGDEQFQRMKEMAGQRGGLYDRNGRALAVTVSLPSLYVNPAKLPEAELKKRLPELLRVLQMPEEELLELVGKRRKDGKLLQRVLLGKALEPVSARALVVGLERDVMWLEEEPVRLYPGKELASPLLGYVGADGLGASGLERVLEGELAGDTYRVMLSQDRKGRSVTPTRDEQRLARQGNSVRLTIDASIQHATEVALWRAMALSAPESAMAVVMDVRTGAILAMATVPAGNPNELSSRAHHDLFQNHAAMDTIEPGSVMKPFIAAAALEEQEVTSETPIDCELGSWVIDGKTIRDDHPKGVISVSEVIKYSSNIGAAKLGLMLGGERTLGYLKNFGFGRSSGLGLPGEVAGLMRSPASIRRLELANTAFGQGITASPIQLTAAVASLANGGVRMMPYLVEAVLDRHGDVETEYEPRIDRRVISEDTARLVTLMMESVIEEGGTGTRARIPGYKVAGKTGTAQKAEAGGYSATKRISSFVGFVPADRPVLAMTVVVDSATIGSRYGGIVAAPVFAEVGAFSMRYLGIEPSPELAAPPRIDTADSTTITESIVLVPDGIGGWVLPDLTGKSMRSVLASLQASGLAVRVEGSGWVSAQAPPAGTSVSAGDSVFITFQ